MNSGSHAPRSTRWLETPATTLTNVVLPTPASPETRIVQPPLSIASSAACERMDSSVVAFDELRGCGHAEILPTSLSYVNKFGVTPALRTCDTCYEMSDGRYDAVVIGGGHHGTIIACYLARSGMSVGVFERAGRLGGGAATVNGPAAGYRMNTCAHWTRFYNHPSYRDFNLYDEGLRYVYPEENEGMVFDDGSSFIGYSASRVVDPVTGRQERSAENVSRTYEQIKRFSQRDADAYMRYLDQYDRYWKAAFGTHRFTTPPAYGTPDALEALCAIPDSGMEPVHAHMSLQALAYDFFESDELRTLFMRAARRRPVASATTRRAFRGSPTTCRWCCRSSRQRFLWAARRPSPMH